MENLPADRAGLEFAHALLTADYLGQRTCDSHRNLAISPNHGRTARKVPFRAQQRPRARSVPEATQRPGHA